MEFSIVTPVYNEPRLQHTLDSIFSQSGIETVETIVVDGESTDETTDVIDFYRDRIDVIVQEPDDGVYDAMNKGIERASGDVVGILNADDRYHDETVLRDIRDAIDSADADVAYGDLVYVNEDDDVVRYWHSGDFSPRRYYFGWMPPHPTFFVRRDLYEEYGCFDLDYRVAADYELMLRFLMKHDVSPAYIDRVLVRMALGGQSNESIWNVLRANYEVYRAWRENSIRGGYLAPVLKPARKVTQYVRSGPQ